MTFWAHLLRCADGSYSCGQTDNLEPRIGKHMQGTIPGHTRNRRPVELIWCQEFPSRLEALEAERRIKGWTRAKKEALIRGDWEALSFLARNRQNAGSPSTSSGRTVGGEDIPIPTIRADLVHGPMVDADLAPITPVRPEPVEGHVSTNPGPIE